MQAIEKEVAAAWRRCRPGADRAGAAAYGGSMFRPPILQRMLVGSWVLITINTLIFGFVIFLPQFFLRQGLTITSSLSYTVVLVRGFAGRLRDRRISCRTLSAGAGASLSPR